MDFYLSMALYWMVTSSLTREGWSISSWNVIAPTSFVLPLPMSQGTFILYDYQCRWYELIGNSHWEAWDVAHNLHKREDLCHYLEAAFLSGCLVLLKLVLPKILKDGLPLAAFEMDSRICIHPHGGGATTSFPSRKRWMITPQLQIQFCRVRCH